MRGAKNIVASPLYNLTRCHFLALSVLQSNSIHYYVLVLFTLTISHDLHTPINCVSFIQTEKPPCFASVHRMFLVYPIESPTDPGELSMVRTWELSLSPKLFRV